VSWTLPCDVLCVGLANGRRNISRSLNLLCLKRNIGNLSAIQEKSGYLLRKRGNEGFVGQREVIQVGPISNDLVRLSEVIITPAAEFWEDYRQLRSSRVRSSRRFCVQVVYKKAGLKGLKLDLCNAESTTDS